MMLYLNRFYRRLSTYIILAVIIASRFLMFDEPVGTTFPPFVTAYFKFLPAGYTSFLLPFLYCVWISGSFSLLRDEKIVLRTGSRYRLLGKQLEYILIDALSFTLLLNVTALPFLCLQGEFYIGRLSFYLLCFVTQLVFFVLLSLIYCLLYTLFSKGYLCGIAIVLYGAMDYVCSIIFMPRWMNLGANLLFTTDHNSAVHTLRILAGAVILLALAAFYLLPKQEYMGRLEAKNE